MAAAGSTTGAALPAAAPGVLAPAQLLPHTILVPPLPPPIPVTLKRGAAGDAAASAKRHRMAVPSRVLFISGLPTDVQEREVITLVNPFDPTAQLSLPAGKGIAFVQLATQEMADKMVAHYGTYPFVLRHHTISVDYSHREKLEIPTVRPATAVLYVTAVNKAVAPDLPIVLQMFSQFGNVVEHVVTKTGNLIVEMDSVESASRVLLNCNNMYTVSGSLLRIVYSAHPSLDKGKKVGEAVAASAPAPAHIMGMGGPQVPMGSVGAMAAMAGHPPHALAPAMVSGISPGQPLGAAMTPGLAAGLAAMSGLGISGVPAGMSVLPAGIAGSVPSGLHGGLSGGMATMPGQLMQMSGPLLHLPGMMSSMHMGGASVSTPAPPPRCVVIASGFGPGTTPDDLFVLFGVYGDVVRVKIMVKKPDTALIQYATPDGAAAAVHHLTGCPVNGRSLAVNYSSVAAITIGSRGTESATTKDFSGSRLHRFRGGDTKYLRHLCSPSTVLHLSNIPPSITEEGLRAMFGQHGTVEGFEFMAKPTMAYVTMATLETSVTALIKCHNNVVGNQTLRVSFSNKGSKSAPGAPGSTTGSGAGAADK